MTMANVRFLRGTALGGVGNDAAPGDVRDLPDAVASAFVAAGRAIALTALPPQEVGVLVVDPPLLKPLPRQRRLKD